MTDPVQSPPDHFLATLKSSSVGLLRLETALLNWWVGHRPIGWTDADHLANPTVNCVMPNEEALATEVARLIAARS